MAKFSLRRYDTQARLSIIIALASIVTMLGLVYCIFRKNMGVFFEEFVLYHGPNRKLAIYLATAITILLAVFGFGLGYNSAGQRRNDKQQLSWLGFFISAVVICLTIVLFLLFHWRAESV